eukprot:3398169-Alexandrium_andersonii.AAC.1
MAGWPRAQSECPLATGRLARAQMGCCGARCGCEFGRGPSSACPAPYARRRQVVARRASGPYCGAVGVAPGARERGRPGTAGDTRC